jgi:hypothetical protein
LGLQILLEYPCGVEYPQYPGIISAMPSIMPSRAVARRRARENRRQLAPKKRHSKSKHLDATVHRRSTGTSVDI